MSGCSFFSGHFSAGCSAFPADGNSLRGLGPELRDTAPKVTGNPARAASDKTGFFILCVGGLLPWTLHKGEPRGPRSPRRRRCKYDRQLCRHRENEQWVHIRSLGLIRTRHSREKGSPSTPNAPSYRSFCPSAASVESVSVQAATLSRAPAIRLCSPGTSPAICLQRSGEDRGGGRGREQTEWRTRGGLHAGGAKRLEERTRRRKHTTRVKATRPEAPGNRA